MRKVICFAVIIFCICTLPLLAKDESKIPNHVVSIELENTSKQLKEEQSTMEPNEQTKELMESVDMKLDNEELIKMLNETTIKPSPIALGYRGNIFLGHWPLHYKSVESKVNWEFQLINVNEVNNYGGDKPVSVHYDQKEEKHVKGGLTVKAQKVDQIMKMIISEAEKKHSFPLTFHATYGKGTKLSQTYDVAVNKVGALKAYAPVLQEKGHVTFGEVYLELKGSKKNLVIKNVTKQEVGAFIPIENHVAFSYKSS
jgi:hypothetical protein